MKSTSKFQLVALTLALLSGSACAAQVAEPELEAGSSTVSIDSTRLVGHVRYLASPALEGRATGTAGNEAAREYIMEAFQNTGLSAVDGEWLQNFSAGGVEGVNVIGQVRGTEQPDRYIVVTAHYDHLGHDGAQIYHGADDNASGSAALIEMARYFVENPPRHSILFAALDAEERGLLGARAFVADPPIPFASIDLNVNLDMVSRNAAGELYAAGTFHYPSLLPLVQEVAEDAPIRLLVGHDRPDGSAGDDWTHLSDHGAFHAVGIPFVYFGVEDHPDYHRPSDTFERIDPAFYVRAVATILDFVRAADR